VLISQRRWLRLRVRSDYGIGRTVRRSGYVVTTRRGGRVVSLIAHRRDVETLVPETRRVKCLKIKRSNTMLKTMSRYNGMLTMGDF